MKLQVIDIPDDVAQTPYWLARKLVGLDLADLITELQAAHRIPGDSRPDLAAKTKHRLYELLGDQRGEVLERGLGTLAPTTIGTLLLEPELLAELQELVLVEGGPYWQRLAEEDPAFDKILPLTLSLPQPIELAARPAIAGSATPGWRRWYISPPLVSLATAASVLVAVFFANQFKSPSGSTSNAWGWNRSGAIAENLPRRDYLNQLANSADEWFKKKPQDRADLAARIGEFRQGCSRLLLAEHQPLSNADREWLRDRCRVWATTFDDYLVKVEDLTKDDDADGNLATLREDMDRSVRELVTKLRKSALKQASQPKDG